MEELPEKEWKRIKKAIESELEPPADVDELLAKLRDKNTEKRQEAAEALMLIGPPAAGAVPALIESLADPKVRNFAAEALGVIGEAARPAVPALLRMLGKSRNHREFSAACTGLESIGVSPEVMLPVLRALLAAADDGVRGQAALNLGSMREPARDDVARLAALLKDSSVKVREYAAMGLEEMGPLATGAVPALRKALRDERDGVRDAAEAALRAIEGTKEQ